MEVDQEKCHEGGSTDAKIHRTILHPKKEKKFNLYRMKRKNKLKIKVWWPVRA